MKIKFLFLTGFLYYTLVYSSSFAQINNISNETNFLKNTPIIELKDSKAELINNSLSGVINLDKVVSINKYKTTPVVSEKSPFLGALFSGLVPGTGEFYAKRYLKAGIFFAIEAGLWTAYAIFQHKGNKKTDEFQQYANEYWSVRKYAQWLVQEGFDGSSGINPNEPDLNVLRAQINICEEKNFSHTLPPYGDQQYYEVIGKYKNFVSGWSEASGVTRNNYGSYNLPQVDFYMSERQKANDYFDWGSRSLTVVILNHIISAADAAWSVTAFNKDIRIKTGFDFRNIYSKSNHRYNLTPFANIQIVF